MLTYHCSRPHLPQRMKRLLLPIQYPFLPTPPEVTTAVADSALHGAWTENIGLK